MMKILKQNDTQSAIAHHTPPQHSDSMKMAKKKSKSH